MEKTVDFRFYDDGYPIHEQLPRVFSVRFNERQINACPCVSISIDNKQVGNVLTDNTHRETGYRYHDIFHLSYLAVLGWSPCIRQLLGRKRRSRSKIDENEDGGLATAAEEGTTYIIFKYAKQYNYFENQSCIPEFLLDIAEMGFSDFEVRSKSRAELQKAILKGFDMFRLLKRNRGGEVLIDMYKADICYASKNVYD